MKKHTKLLLILRHAKSSWEFAELSDHDRPLNNRGKRDALRIGKKLLKEGIVPQLIISSSAIRASSTALKVAKACGYQGEIIVNNLFYYRFIQIANPEKKDDRYDIIASRTHHTNNYWRYYRTMNTILPACCVC